MPALPQPRRDQPARSAGGRERLAGAALALYLVSGSWSLARVAGVEPSPFWEPRAWAVAMVVLLALLPSGVSARSTRSAVVPEFAWLAFSLLAVTWAPDLVLAREQAIDLGLLLAVALALHRLSSGGRTEQLAASLRVGLLVLLFGLMVTGMAGLGGGRLAVLGGGPNVFGRNMGLLCVLALEHALFAERRGPRMLIWVGIACVAAGFVALSGSRGAMIASFLAASVLLVLGRARLGRRLAVLLAVIGLFVALLLFTPLGVQVMESFSSRVLDLLLGERYVSSRDRIYVIALEGGAQSPVIGHGIASFAASTPWPYAHNLVLDAWYETGAIGVALLGLYLGRSARVLAGLGSRGRELWIALGVLMLFASQFSGGRYDARGLLVFAAISIALPPTQVVAPRVASRRQT
jgi:O-antigen ligase